MKTPAASIPIRFRTVLIWATTPWRSPSSESKWSSEAWPKLVEKVTKEGDGYQHARQAFGILLSTEGTALFMAARYVGGVYVNRSHKGDPKAADPFVVVEPKKQREALQLLEDQMFSDAPFEFPPTFYNHLATSRWDHWGSKIPLRDDFPIHEVIAMWQERTLEQLLSPLTLERLSDSELKVPADQDAFTTVELIHGLTTAIFSETDNLKAGRLHESQAGDQQPPPQFAADLFEADGRIGDGRIGAPEDCQTVASAELKSLPRPDRQAAGRQGQARRLQPRPSSRNVAANRQSAGAHLQLRALRRGRLADIT